MNNQPGFIPVISMFPSPIFPQFIPTIIAPMIPYNLIPPLQNNNYPHANSQNNDESYQMPPGLSDQNMVYPSYGPYYISQQNNNNNSCAEGFNSTIHPYNYGNFDNQDSEFASILNSVYTSVWDDENPLKKNIHSEISVYQGENIQSEEWERFLFGLQKQEVNNLDSENAIFQKLIENKRRESRFSEFCDDDQINRTSFKFDDFGVIHQRLRIMDSYKVEMNEGILKWEVNEVENEEFSNNQNTTVKVHEFGVIQPIGSGLVKQKGSTESDGEIGNIKDLLSDNEGEDEQKIEENNDQEQPKNEENTCLQDLMSKDLNDQRGVDLLETIRQLQKQNLGPFFIDYQLPENNNEEKEKDASLQPLEDNNQQKKKNKKKRKNKNRKNIKKTTTTIIENPELDTTLKLQKTISTEDKQKTSTTTIDNDDSEVTRAKRILAELEEAINSLENPKPKTTAARNSKDYRENEDDFKSGSERIETNHSASTDFGEQSSTESGKNDQKLSKAQKKRLSKQKKQHMQSINDYIESTSAIHKIDSNYIAMLSSVLAEDPFALVKLKEVVLAQNANENTGMMELGFTEEEIQEIEEVNLELEKTLKRRMNNESDSEHNSSNYHDETDSPCGIKYDDGEKYYEIPEKNKRVMPMPEFLGEDFYKLHYGANGVGSERIVGILDEEPHISEDDLTAISYLEELMKNRANFLADFGVSGFGPFDEEK